MGLARSSRRTLTQNIAMNPSQLKRRGPTRDPKDRILIVGTTALHDSYSRWLLEKVDHHPGFVKLVQSHRDPEDVLREAGKLARAQRTMGSECQQVWVVLDGVDQDQARDLESTRASRGISVVSSTPDFRTWLVLHRAELEGRPVESLVETFDALVPEFERPFPEYANDLLGQFQAAKSRAVSLMDGRFASDVHRLVDAVLASEARFQGRATVDLI